MVNNRQVVLVLMVVATLLMGCGNSVATSQTRDNFSLPQIPSTLADVSSRREYLAQHYWDNFDFKNLKLFENDSLIGVAVGGYIQVLMMNPPTVVERSVDLALSGALSAGYDPFEMLSSKLEDYLYDPNSPMRNEELYIYVLRYTIDKAPLEDIYKLRSRKQLDMVMKNRVGEEAIDFEFETLGGKVGSLHAIDSPYTILFFNTPDCEDCARVKSYIGSSCTLSARVEAAELTILGIYTERDDELWRKSNYPSIILNSADLKGQISSGRLYDLKALPTLYLLDGEKKVILKDRSVEEIEGYLGRCN